ncbi:MAG: glycosyltransferase, partial [Acidobacteriota bacterium]
MALQTSIIVPNSNSPFIGATLESIQRQADDVGRFEIVVVGQDESHLVPRDGSIHFIETRDPMGPGAARNLGVEASQGEHILFTDADCRPSRDWIRRIVDRLEDAPVVGGSVRFALRGNPWAVGDNIASFHELLEDRSSGRNRGPVGTLNLGLHREAWETVGPFDSDLITSEDYDWFLRARAVGLDVYFEPLASVEHSDVRQSRVDLERHAEWYGAHFLQFCDKHPGIFAQGPTWKSRRALAATRVLKSVISAMA